ncbi:MAG TPA: TROVE domain-containing protein, partial [Vineibacter sp.]|nr:TROVE domain-containing protein [Vineibacter sp.]
MNYRKLFSFLQTSQREPIPGRADMVRNDAGGFVFALDLWQRLDRFLVLGSEGGTYYATERKLTRDNAEAVLRAIQLDGARAVACIVEVSVAGRAPKNDPALFALAMAAGMGDDATRAAALSALPKVARTASHLFVFAEYVAGFRGWGRGLRRAIADWYLAMPLDRLVLQAVKYKARGEKGHRWSHRDLLRLAHPMPAAEDAARRALFDRIVRPDGAAELPAGLERLAAAEALMRSTEPREAARLIVDHRLPREAVPSALQRSPEVWTALLADMPMTAMLRSLGRMASIGMLVEGSDAERTVRARLADRDRLTGARVHPIHVLLALAMYGRGQGLRGGLAWTPAPGVLDALDAAFYAAFADVTPAGKRVAIGLDVSGSMSTGMVAGTPLTPRVAAAAMAMITVAREPEALVWAFSDRMVPIAVSPRQRLDDVVKATSNLPFGGTDCALPMLHALETKAEVDAFV